MAIHAVACDRRVVWTDALFNDNPFLSPAMFEEFITPYLGQLVSGSREMRFYVIKHTDGNIMPILDGLVSTELHARHSLDPQSKVIWLR